MSLEPYASTLQCNFISTKETKKYDLPHLPVPKLKDTLDKFLKTAKPHLNDNEFANTTKIVSEFLSKDGIGNKLQSLLEERAKKSTNWLEDWWLRTAYLSYRDPVVVYSSPGLVFPFRQFQERNEQLMYAAKTVLASLEYKTMIYSDQIPTDMMGKSPLDMSQYKKIFGTCRIPSEKTDKISYNDSKHITVICNGQIWHLDIVGSDDQHLSEEQLVKNLMFIVEKSTPCEYPIGILTSDNRDNWAVAYNTLSKDMTNKNSLRDVEESLFVLCLDAACGLWRCKDKNAQQILAGAQTIYGGGPNSNGANRWFDKTVQFIVGEDGVVGLTYEHTPAEGQPIAVLTDFIIDKIDNNKFTRSPGTNALSEPKLLQFNVDSNVTNMINTAKQNLDKLGNNLELNCFTYDKYGKNFVKSQKFSPDSYLQMAMQYAFYRLHKCPGAHYESAATRMYIGGRTETIRSCSIESIDFAKTMLDAKRTNKEKIASMKKAIDAHKHYTVQALQGFGVDRHLLGLKLIALENNIQIPKLYTDPGYVRSAHMRISTSQVACKCDGFMCYGPLVGNGYATCYNPRNDDVNFALSAFVDNEETDCGKYRAALEDSLKDMHDLLLNNTQSKL